MMLFCVFLLLSGAFEGLCSEIVAFLGVSIFTCCLIPTQYVIGISLIFVDFINM